MPPEPNFKSEELSDSYFAFPQGMHSGIAPDLLEKNQLAFLTNGTVRGDFPSHRPTFRKLAVTFANASDLAAFQSGKFQGACVYNPINAPDCIAVSVNGNIYELIPGYLNASGVNVNPSGGGNPATPNQAFMFQTERWLVINDGVSIPIFINGQTSLRSNSGGYAVSLTNVNDPNGGGTYLAGTPAVIKSSQSFAVLYTGLSCPLPTGGQFGGGGPTAPIKPPAPPPQTTPAPPPPPTTTTPPASSAHWPWLPDNTNNWIPPSGIG